MISEGPPIDPDTKKIARQAGASGAVGIEIVLALGVGYFGGNYLDNRFGTTPWLTGIGTAVGIGAAISALVRVTRQYQKQIEDEDARKHPPPATSTSDGQDPPRQD